MDAMPFSQIAAKASGAPANLTPPMPSGGALPPPPAGLGAAMAPPAPAAPMGPPPGLPAMPPPSAPAAPPYTTRLQADGSSIYVIPSPDGDPGKDVVLGVNPPPKIPKAFQQPASPPAQ